MQKAISKYWPVFVLPTLLAFIIGFIWPFIWGIYLSFQRFTTVSKTTFVGLQNYINVFSDETFLHAFSFTAAFTVVSTVLINVCAFAIALVLTRGIRGTNIFRTVYFMPNLIGGILLGYIWQILLNGVLANLQRPLLALDAKAGFVGLVILMCWQQIGYMMIIYIAGLQAVPEDMLEAARIDGANRWQTLWRVTIPNVMPSITICMFLSLTNGFKLFDQNLALTAGRPFQQLGNGETIKTTEMLALNIVNAFGTNGGGNRGIKWNLDPEISELCQLNGTVQEGVAKGRPKMETDINAANFILRVSPETNGALSFRSWSFVKDQCGVDASFLSEGHIADKITFDDLAHRPAKTFSAPDWSGTENDEIPYVAFWQNKYLLLPWRTITGRQQFYQDHAWMRAFGQQFAQYRAPANQRALSGYRDVADNGNKAIILNFMTAHQKWGIHSTYYDNERMLTLSRGGPVVWMSDIDAANAGIVDNDWIECWNANGAVVGRAIVSSRMPEGLCVMQHATEKTVNTPGSEVTGLRGGAHNSPIRVILNPTHMIGGYGHLSYAFNYYGTIAPNRDDFAWVRKMNKVDWMDEEADKKGGAV